MQIIRPIRRLIRHLIRALASLLDRLSDHRLTPNMVTIAGTIAHVGIAFLLAFGQTAWAGALLIIFGLSDTLDGELARLQGRASSAGMLLDAATDRFKESLLYVGAAYLLASSHDPRLATLAVAACGASVSVSYVKAKGEAAISVKRAHMSHAQLNRLFSDGLATFDIRIIILIIGLISGQLPLALALIALLAGFTALQRLYYISHALRRVQS